MTVTVLNIAGRTVRRVATDRAATKGRNTLLWDAKSDRGLRAPSGMYLVQIEARCADGSASRALTSLRLSR